MSTELAPREPIFDAVITAIADARDQSVMDIEPPLASVIDPDALEKLVHSMESWPEGAVGHVRFEYGEQVVTITEEGAVTVTDSSV